MGHDFWTRYLVAFSHVRVVARVQSCPTPPSRARRVDGPGVSVWNLPFYSGPKGYLRNLRSVERSIRKAASPEDAVLLRVPSRLGSVLASARTGKGLPFALEVVGDPYDVFSGESTRTPLQPLLRRWFTASLRQQARTALGVAYVTERTLQKRYPHSPKAISTHYSSIELPDNAFAARPRDEASFIGASRLISVGSLQQPYKGIDVLIRSVALLNRRGILVSLTHIGDGAYRPPLMDLAKELGISDKVSFAGRIPPGDQVREHLRNADLFVLPSRTEGLPRALIEAMALGLPAVASQVGGVPELLEPQYTVPAGDERALADRIEWMIGDEVNLCRASGQNLARAQDFSDAVLAPRRKAFYEALLSAFARSAAAGQTPA
ncbi:glycosyltransferase [Actinoplanes sp. NPDC049316]|uniref:glycosyltransferase n=1 Tax=Actinoplanes sp. NPDC049316 TaxID=3154727 RepID=UPI0034141D32